jgi:HEAT repeat protein
LAHWQKDSDLVAVRGAAALALGRIGKDAGSAAEALAGALRDKDKDVRGAAALALSRIGKEGKAAVPALRDLLKDDNRQVQTYGRCALQFAGIT